MTRWMIPVLCAFLIAAVARADDTDKPPADKVGKDELKPPKKPATPATPEGESEEAKILERLVKNTKAAEEKLAEREQQIDAFRELSTSLAHDDVSASA